MDKRTISILLAFTVVGLLLRVYWVLQVPTVQLYDFATFLEIASNIFYGEGHSINGNPVAWVGPGYSYLLAAFHWIAGSALPGHALVLNLILSMATLVMTGFVYRLWFPGDDLSLIFAYGFTALFPNLIAYNNVAGTETMFLFLLVGMLLARLYIPSGFKQAAVLGLLCALAALTKPFMLAYPAVAFAMWWMGGKNLKQSLLRTALMAGVMLLVIMPWTIRNYQAFGRFILISYNMGYNQLINNNYANIRGSWMRLDTVPMTEELRAQIEQSLQDGRSIKEAYELEGPMGAAARHWMIRNPIAVSQLALMRVQRTFFNGADDISQWAMNNFDFYDRPGASPVRRQRTMHFFEGIFAITVNVFSTVGLLFVLITFWPYARDFFCLSHQRHLPLAEGMVFIHIAFFVVIVAAFEGQERYAHPVFIFFIFAMIWLCSRRKSAP